ncbi:hypothetical protein EHS25_005272 [Saitozyma podzolica]|uniref:Uncharacterized protein n=1 Tax=Saitozyma podzolica TaxID=1890683 RepID=A0A427XYZ1_9TREE|nr:hypothetical protein EHS25_005272 [Saitozyma podzolica]
MRSILNLLLLLSLLGLSSAGPAWRGGRRSSDFVERCKTNAECIRSHQPLLRPAKRIPKSDSRTLVDRSEYTAPFAFSTPGLYTVSVDTNGTYHISVTGGSGGNGGLTGNTYTGGAAATIQGEFYLTTDQTFFMVVGAAGLSGVNAVAGGGGGGGGGSFIYTPDNSLLVAAAGGGGAGRAQQGQPASTGTTATAGFYGAAAGTGGLGGGASTGSDIGGSGAGFNGDGGTTSGAGNGVGGTTGPYWQGGSNQYAPGGYGGGGGGSIDAGGGGAGYNGGGGGGDTSGGGGGGSFIDDTVASQITPPSLAATSGNGFISVVLLP